MAEKIKIHIKGELDKYNITLHPPWVFLKSCDFYTNRSVGIGIDCMLILTSYPNLLLKKYEYS